MKADHAAELIPPRHSAAANGTFTIEHTQLTIAMRGPTKRSRGPSEAVAVDEQCVHQGSGTSTARKPDRVAEDRAPYAASDVGDG